MGARIDPKRVARFVVLSAAVAVAPSPLAGGEWGRPTHAFTGFSRHTTYLVDIVKGSASHPVGAWNRSVSNRVAFAAEEPDEDVHGKP